MLPPAHRLRDAEGFRVATRRGDRASSRSLVVHFRRSAEYIDAPALVGFVVGKRVGRAVTRNRVKRRLRHLVRDRLLSLPGGSTMVVRALPRAADADSQELAADLDRSLARLSVGAR